MSGVHRLMQPKTKDIEELLRKDGTDGPLTKQLQSLLTFPVNDDVLLNCNIGVEDLSSDMSGDTGITRIATRRFRAPLPGAPSLLRSDGDGGVSPL